MKKKYVLGKGSVWGFSSSTEPTSKWDAIGIGNAHRQQVSLKMPPIKVMDKIMRLQGDYEMTLILEIKKK